MTGNNGCWLTILLIANVYFLYSFFGCESSYDPHLYQRFSTGCQEFDHEKVSIGTTNRHKLLIKYENEVVKWAKKVGCKYYSFNFNFYSKKSCVEGGYDYTYSGYCTKEEKYSETNDKVPQ